MSQRHPGARRSRTGPSSDPDDAFLARVLHVGKWAEANQQVLTVLAVIAAIAVAGVIYYGNYRSSLAQQAAQQLETVHQSISISDTQGAKDQLILFLERFSGTPYEGEARLLLGDLYLREGSPQQAQAVLEPLGGSPREPIDFQGATLLAAAYEQDERWNEAEAVYLEIADRSRLEFQVKNALAAAARIRSRQGNAAGAIELYERVLESLEEDNPERGLYEMRIAELRASENA
jgi:predicted negative regulator of RcsB-dependent stress response